MGIVDRKTGEIIQMPEFSKEQMELMAEHLIRGYIRKHPEVITEELGKD